MNRRDFLQALSVAVITAGCTGKKLNLSGTAGDLYQMPAFGNARLLHFTDCHAQLMPVYYREPAMNIGVGQAQGKPPHLTGRQFLDFYGIKDNSRLAHAFTHLNFAEVAQQYGKTGGFAHLATLVKQLRGEAGEGNTLLLDGGDTWQGSATALWTQGQDMVSACNLLGVDIMTGHWEFTYGIEQVLANIQQFNGEFIAQNIALTEEAQFVRSTESAAVFKPYVIKALNNARIAVIGQAFPYTPIANPRRFVPDWQFGIQEDNLQTIIDEIRQNQHADVIVLLSHNGMDVDLKLASRVTGLDIILGGHTHDAMPRPVLVENTKGKTWVTNAGSHGKFLAVLDFDVKNGRLRDFKYALLPVFSNLLPPDPEMQQLIEDIRRPYLAQLQKPLGVAETLLYRRDQFHGSFDQLILDALLKVHDVEIAFSPGFRWGHAVLPGDVITLEDVMNHTAITYPETSVRNFSGTEIKAILEDVADNLFNKDPYYQQGGDMVRIGGMGFKCDPGAEFGRRISALTLNNGTAVQAQKKYNVAGWAGVGEAVQGRPVWEIVADYLGTR